jgi:UDP-glucose 4-epimerase
MKNKTLNSSKKVLVTGGAGFIGAHVARQLNTAGYDVTILDDLSGGYEANVPENCTFVEGSILDKKLLANMFEQKKFSHVFHLAAYAAEGLSHFIRCYNYQNNLIGSMNLINLSIEHKVQRFVFTSSIAVYGKGQVPMVESLTPEPEDPYGIAKLAVEMDLKSAHHMFGLPYTIFRPHNVYGELQNIGDRYRNVVGIFMNQIMRNEALTIFGDGSQTRAFSYIDEVAIPISSCIEIPKTAGQIFNIGADIPCTVNDLAQFVMKAMGRTVPINHIEKRNEVEHAYSDHSKVKQFFPNLPANVSLDEGLRKMATWAYEVGPRKTNLFMDIELWEGLPPSWSREFRLAS